MAEAKQGNVAIVDDDEGVRRALSLLVESVGHDVYCFVSGDSFLDAEAPPAPACVLLDLRMPGSDGLEVQQRLHDAGSRLPVIFLTGHGDVADAVLALKRGALDFFEKPAFDRTALLGCIGDALERHQRALRRSDGERVLRERLQTLSRRELEVARLAAGGSANKVIGAELGISERTVEIHRGRAMKKLGLRTLPELIRLEAAFAESGARDVDRGHD